MGYIGELSINMEIKALTLNCWGIPMVSKHRSQRMNAIADVLASSNYDVVCLQEVWSENDFYLIREAAQERLPHSHYFYSGVLGSGICVFSKHPIIDVHFHKWMLNGYPHKVHHGDWWGGKGVGLCKFLINKMVIYVYTTHLHAEYNRKHDEYHSCRAIQAFEMAKFIELSSQGADVTLVIGDLNTEPEDLPYRLITTIPNLRDSFVKSDDKLDLPTNLHPKNTYTPSHNISNELPGVRIDYILYKGSSNVSIELKSHSLPLLERIPGGKCSYSDHEAVAANLTVKRTQMECFCEDVLKKKAVLSEAIDSCEKAVIKIRWNKKFYWILTLALITTICLTFSYEMEFNIYLQIFRIPLIFIISYYLFMATFWNAMERNAIYSAKLAMERSLHGLDYCD